MFYFKVNSYLKRECCDDNFVTPQMVALHNEDKYEHVRERKKKKKLEQQRKARALDQLDDVTNDEPLEVVDAESYGAQGETDDMLERHEALYEEASALVDLIMVDVPLDFVSVGLS